jgi:hypothetical protein
MRLIVAVGDKESKGIEDEAPSSGGELVSQDVAHGQEDDANDGGDQDQDDSVLNETGSGNIGHERRLMPERGEEKSN